MEIRPEIVQRIAELAHLELSPEEMELYGQQLGQILSYFAKLNELDVTAVEPLAQVLAGGTDPATAWREDVVVPSGLSEELLAAGPDVRPPFFRVPKVIEREP